MHTILNVLYPGCVTYETALALELLASHFRIITTTPDGKPHRASNGTVLVADCSFAEVDLRDCAAILVPGGNPESIANNTDIDVVLRGGAEKGLLVAAICAGPFLLAKAGVLRGRRIAHGYQREQLEFLREIFAGVELTDESLVWAGSILTAKASVHIDFGVEVASYLGVVPSERKEYLKRYYKGEVLPEEQGRLPLQVLMIPYRPQGDGLQYGLFRRADDDSWQFIAGGVESGETIAEAALREAHEEAGISRDAELTKLASVCSVPANVFKDWKSWPEGTFVVTEHAFAVRLPERSQVRLSAEHAEFRWCTYDEALKLLKWDSNKTALWELSERLKKRGQLQGERSGL